MVSLIITFKIKRILAQLFRGQCSAKGVDVAVEQLQQERIVSDAG